MVYFQIKAFRNRMGSLLTLFFNPETLLGKLQIWHSCFVLSVYGNFIELWFEKLSYCCFCNLLVLRICGNNLHRERLCFNFSSSSSLTVQAASIMLLSGAPNKWDALVVLRQGENPGQGCDCCGRCCQSGSKWMILAQRCSLRLNHPLRKGMK